MTTSDPMDMFSQVQKMAADMQAARDALANTLIEATAGGGVIKATVTGDGHLKAIRIDPSVVDPDDIETLEDLVVAAVNEAMREAGELEAQKLGGATGGLDLDGMLGSLGGLGGMLGGGTDKPL
jgi:DNA-binding YbaB/EbfC family protein